MKKWLLVAGLGFLLAFGGFYIGYRYGYLAVVAQRKATPHQSPTMASPGPALALDKHRAARNETATAPDFSNSSQIAGSVTEGVKAQLRFDFLKEISLKYHAFFENRRLSPEQIDLLQEILVDQRMIGLEAGLQNGTADTPSTAKAISEAYEKNQQLLRTLLGEDGPSALREYETQIAQGENTSAGLAAIEAVAPLPELTKLALGDKLANFSPNAGIGDLIVAGIPINESQRQTLLAHGNEVIADITREMNGQLTASQVAALQQWAQTAINSNVGFANVILNARNQAAQPNADSQSASKP
jgi:hypothetical protein